jgi:hypothetical protein
MEVGQGHIGGCSAIGGGKKKIYIYIYNKQVKHFFLLYLFHPETKVYIA